ncbi:hypothetical protein [Pseudomonas sp.]|jgi:hypothetical protein|uniref:hypothetical protein n=1 Tax=Pseudomonas sp. TaxID=306 RepID=UPI002EDA3DD1
MNTTRRITIPEQRLQRLASANEFIRSIASCGRHFFADTGAGHGAYLSLNARASIVWLHDDYTGKQINTAKEGRWDGFSHGGTLKSLVGSIARHVLDGSTMRFGYFQPKMDNGFENPWGYGDDILAVRAEGVRLGLIKAPAQPVEAAA